MPCNPHRHRLWYCGAFLVTPPSSLRRRCCDNSSPTTSTATAPDPPVSVATDSTNSSRDFVRIIRSMAVSLISRAVSADTTSPARACPSSIRLATSTTPLSTPRQALLRSYTAASGFTRSSWATAQAVAGSNCSRHTPA